MRLISVNLALLRPCELHPKSFLCYLEISCSGIFYRYHNKEGVEVIFTFIFFKFFPFCGEEGMEKQVPLIKAPSMPMYTGPVQRRASFVDVKVYKSHKISYYVYTGADCTKCFEPIIC